MWVDVDKIASKKIDVDKIWGFNSIQPQKNDHLVLTILNFYKVITYVWFFKIRRGFTSITPMSTFKSLFNILYLNLIIPQN
jgi:hypothetical protein